ncbi:MAG: hypothetical protein AAF692_08670 [Pseudomonadota bacterium]
MAALHFRGPRRWHAPALALGPIAGIAIVMAYAGGWYTIELPKEYRVFFLAFPGGRI